MPRGLWREGRLSWGVVGVIAFATVSLIALDLAWRLVKLQFDTFLIYAFFAEAAAALVVIVAAGLVWRRRWRR